MTGDVCTVQARERVEKQQGLQQQASQTHAEKLTALAELKAAREALKEAQVLSLLVAVDALKAPLLLLGAANLTVRASITATYSISSC